MFLQNQSIVDIIKEQLDEADSNQEFYATYTDCAKRNALEITT
jgi:recombinational DNA repair protein (RecF pathway)